MNRACASSLWLGLVPEQNAATYTLSSISISQMEEWEPRGTGSPGTRTQGWEAETQDPCLRGSLLPLTWQP